MNVYHTPQYQSFRQEHAFLFSEDCLCQRPGKEPELPQGWTVRTSRYQGASTAPPGTSCWTAGARWCILGTISTTTGSFTGSFPTPTETTTWSSGRTCTATAS